MATAGDGNIRPLDLDEMTPELREVIAPRVERLGYLGDFFRYTGHQPAALRAALAYASTLREVVPPRLAEIVVLTVSARAGNRYEQVQHEPLAVKAGLELAEIEALVNGDALRCESFGEDDRGALDLAVAAGENDSEATAAALERLIDAASAEIAVGVLLMAGHYSGFAIVANALPLRLPVASLVEPG